MVELQENPDKNHIEIKFGTEVKVHVRNDQKKAPLIGPFGHIFKMADFGQTTKILMSSKS